MTTPDGDERAAHEALPKRSGWLRRQFADVFYVAKNDRKWWMLPLLFMLLILTALLITATALGPLAPFVYPFL